MPLGLVKLRCHLAKHTLKSPAHRALIVRKLKGLEDFISFTSVHWEMLEKGKNSLVRNCNTPMSL